VNVSILALVFNQSINQSINFISGIKAHIEKRQAERAHDRHESVLAPYYTFRISYESFCIFPGYVSVLVSDVCRIINITHRNIHYTCTCSRKILLATSLLQVDLSEYNVIKYLLILHTLSPGGSSL